MKPSLKLYTCAELQSVNSHVSFNLENHTDFADVCIIKVIVLAVRKLFRQSTKGGQEWSTHSPRAVNRPAFSDDGSPPRRLDQGTLTVI